MKTTLPAVLCALACSVPIHAANIGKNEPRAPTYEEIRARQTLGQVIAAPNGNFFLYEWLRPYNWVRDTGKLPAPAADRMQAWLYKVDVDILPTTSQYLFHPGSGCSYWLGGLSPDTHKVAFYELDNDTNTVKAGVWSLSESKLTWFDVPPDAARIEQRATWVSNDEVIYPAKSGSAQFVRANAATGVAKPCLDCGPLIEKLRAISVEDKQKIPAPNDVGSDASILAQSAQGELAVYEKDTPDVLTLMFKKGSNEPEVVFENKRH